MPIGEKLHKMYEMVSYIKKDKRNEHQKYNYVSDEVVMEKVHAACVALKVISIPTFKGEKTQSLSITKYPDGTEKQTTVTHIVSSLDLTVMDVEDNTAVHVYIEGEGMDHGDKATPKAQTGALKQAWLKLLNLSSGDDPEADEKTDETMSHDDPEKKDEKGEPVSDGEYYLGIKIPNCLCGQKARVWDPNDGKGYFMFYCAKRKTDPTKCSFSQKGR